MKSSIGKRSTALSCSFKPFTLLCLLCLMCLPSFCAGADKKWHWIKAANSTNGWTIEQGNADVVITGTTFSAQLFSGSDQEPTTVLKGSIRANAVTAKEVSSASDYTGSTYHGSFATKRWPEFSGTIGADCITLSDGWGMIGITRTVDK